jgi:unsaturated chondroitin disaccharide hydrolase
MKGLEPRSGTRARFVGARESLTASATHLMRSLLRGALILSGVISLRAAEPPMAEVVRESLNFSAAQYAGLLERVQGKSGFPRTVEKGEIKMVRASDWTSGFFPGSLWYLFEATGDRKWRDAAAASTAGLISVKDQRNTHDLGFMLYCSYGNGLRLANEPGYREVLLAGAATLALRFNPAVGCIKSWDHEKAEFPVIIDNMMNLELLLWAAREGDTPRYRDISLTHADTTLRNHFRPDHSSYHGVLYHPASGEIMKRRTYQGAADSSAWARGQSWGLYGYTLMYRLTREARYLEQANKIATFLTSHPRMPSDKVPFWDYDAPDLAAAPRDASAAAIMCCALFELSEMVDAETGRRYHTFAEQQLRSLASPAYRAKLGENHGFLLMHSVGHLPAKSEIDVPINYADYYFIEALLRCKARLERKP